MGGGHELADGVSGEGEGGAARRRHRGGQKPWKRAFRRYTGYTQERPRARATTTAGSDGGGSSNKTRKKRTGAERYWGGGEEGRQRGRRRGAWSYQQQSRRSKSCHSRVSQRDAQGDCGRRRRAAGGGGGCGQTALCAVVATGRPGHRLQLGARGGWRMADGGWRSQQHAAAAAALQPSHRRAGHDRLVLATGEAVAGTVVRQVVR